MSEKRCGRKSRPASLYVDSQHFRELWVQRNHAFMTTLASYSDGELTEIDLSVAEGGTFGCTDACAVEQRE